MALPADVIGNILVYACESPKDAAARRWSLSKAWLEAHGAPALWRTLVITSVPFAGAHCTCSAWERAPPQLRRAVERHTCRVEVMDARGDRQTYHVWNAHYNLGRGLAGQRFAHLEEVCLKVYSTNTAQSYVEDEAALRPLFGARCLDFELNGRTEGENTESFLYGGNAYALLRNFTRLRCLQLGDWGPTVFLEPDYDQTNIRGLVASGGEPEAIVRRYTYLDREPARRLTQLSLLEGEAFMVPGKVPANFFPHMEYIELDLSGTRTHSVPLLFAGVAAACPSLKLLFVRFCEDDTNSWERPENYSVFAHAPPSLTALIMSLDELRLPEATSLRSSNSTASSLVSLISGHLPAGVHIHLIAHSVVDDRLLPKGPWRPAHPRLPIPRLPMNCDDAALAQDTFTFWGTPPS